MNPTAKSCGAGLLNEGETKEIGLAPEAVAAPGQVAAEGAGGDGNIALGDPDGAAPARAGVTRERADQDVRAAERLVAGERAAGDRDARLRPREERAAADRAADRRAHERKRRAAPGVAAVAPPGQVVAQR